MASIAGHAAGLIAAVAAVAFLVFLPWAIRDWLTFGSPFPGQAVANAFSISGFDIFAWNDPPTLSRYLAVGPAQLLEMRVDGFTHNLFSVLLLPGLPVSLIGLIGAALGDPRRRHPAAGHRQLRRVPRDQPGLPGRHDVGHVPPRRRAVPGAPGRLGAARRSMR